MTDLDYYKGAYENLRKIVDLVEARLQLALESSDNNLKLARLYIEDASVYREEVLKLREKIAKLEADK